jgi:hypothetical protein
MISPRGQKTHRWPYRIGGGKPPSRTRRHAVERPIRQWNWMSRMFQNSAAVGASPSSLSALMLMPLRCACEGRPTQLVSQSLSSFDGQVIQGGSTSARLAMAARLPLCSRRRLRRSGANESRACLLQYAPSDLVS